MAGCVSTWKVTAIIAMTAPDHCGVVRTTVCTRARHLVQTAVIDLGHASCEALVLNHHVYNTVQYANRQNHSL